MRTTAIWLVSALAGCGGPAANGSDAGGSDAGGSDSGARGDAAPIDSGPSVTRDGGPPRDAGLPAMLPYRGVALAGAEFGASIGATFNGNTLGAIPGDYYYPNSDLSAGGPSWPAGPDGRAIETVLLSPYLRGKAMNTIRLPFRWERLQHSLDASSAGPLSGAQAVATFNPAELAALQSAVEDLKSSGFVVLLDAHNYAYYGRPADIASGANGHPIGSAEVPDQAFANLWIGLASLYSGDPQVVFDIMNEPATPMDPPGSAAGTAWLTAAQAAIDGIRSTGATNLILVCGNNFAGPDEFTDGGWSAPLAALHDSGDNFAFEVHDYPDDGFGGSDNCTTDTVASTLAALQTFVTWAHAHGARALLGEFSGGIDTSASPECVTAIGMMLDFLTAHPDVFIGWTYWAAGAGFGADEPINASVLTGHDSPQMMALLPYLGG